MAKQQKPRYASGQAIETTETNTLQQILQLNYQLN